MTSQTIEAPVGTDTPEQAPDQNPKPLSEGKQTVGTTIGLWVFVALPLIAFLAAIPIAWGGWLGWTDIGLMIAMYFISGFGVTVGFHRYLTHGSFKASRPLRIALALTGSMAVQGSVIQWVADHRRHHQFSDLEGDPHSPWRFGTSVWGLAKGLIHAHIGWLFLRDVSNRDRFAPDLVADRDLQKIDKLFVPLVLASIFLPAVAGGLITGSWKGALTAFFWAGLVRIGLLHHVTWAINSVCHVFGERPFAMRKGDRATNFWPLAILSMGESWHNMHHADPTSARHGVLKGQIDMSARLIWIFEKLRWITHVRWPKPERIRAKMMS